MGRLRAPAHSGPLRTRTPPALTAVCLILAVVLLAPWSGCAAGKEGPSPGSTTAASTTSTALTPGGDPAAETTPPTSSGATDPGETGVTAPPVSGPRADTDAGGPGSLGPTRVYTDPEYGFTFAYPEGWKLTAQAGAEEGPGGVSLRDVGAFDPTGSKAGGVLLDGVAVSVFRLNVVVNTELLPAFEKEVEDVVTALRGRLSSVEVVEELKPTTVNGLPGFETTHTFSYKGRRLRSRVVFLVGGAFEYQLTTQAAESSWAVSGPGLDLLVGSFTPAD